MTAIMIIATVLIIVLFKIKPYALLYVIFFAKIVCNTENFINFVGT